MIILIRLMLVTWLFPALAMAATVGGGGAGSAQGLDDVIATERTYGAATSQATAARFGSSAAGVYVSIGYDATLGTFVTCEVAGVLDDCNKAFKLLAGRTLTVLNASDVSLLNVDNDTGITTIKELKVTSNNSILVPLNARGAATSALESIVTNQPSDYYLTVTDANTDAADFSFIVPPTSGMAGGTTATFRLVGVSKNASPSGNIDLDCAMSAYTPGADTFTAHVTTGEVTALMTPATQNRAVAVATSAHTINGGAIAAGDIVHGSCEVDATATTSAQMSDFRLWGWVLVTVN